MKRRAILDAARELFVRQGVDRVSMDAVAAHAKVSKATVYDYFGDKRRLFLAILAAATESLNALTERAIAAHLADDAEITTRDRLEEAFIGFSVELGTTMIASAEYAAAFALVAQQRWHSPGTSDEVSTRAPQAALAERIAHFAEAGLLEASDVTMAAAHLAALTILLAYDDQPNAANVDLGRIRHIMTEGVRTFMRAYAKPQ
ncbi:TetR/AcrR family transcriptional regulator [Amycolatopsis australiensis]|uniref:TetR/AcrR family transcriptional regulator n=1 Tax=Amycolatopsis australiensis TaxID=546364 RepID=UPI001FE8C3AE|nr:TetR/AcrR family transcriptional regulator [Amycolatopsis australiensis]